jgi:hypothetical protein
MENNLKKIKVGNPLQNLEMWEWLDAYNLAENDEQLARLYHNLLDHAEATENTLLESITHSMIVYSTEKSFNLQILL